jgi:hypothetical protein
MIKRESTIISLPTGKGKTLVAARAIDFFLEERPTQKVYAFSAVCMSALYQLPHFPQVLFMVPTVPLVDQQAAYCRRHCLLQPAIRVVELHGDKIDGWDQTAWNECLLAHQVVVATPEILRRAFVDSAFVDASQFSLLILDECHHATGNSAYASIMRDAVWPKVQSAGSSAVAPRILGLTASFVNGSLTHIEAKRQQLEVLLQAQLFSPQLPEESPDEQTRFETIRWAEDSLPEGYKALVQQKLQILLEPLEQEFAIPDRKKVNSRAEHVLLELGMTGFIFYLREAILPQLEAHYQNLATLHTDPVKQQKARELAERVPQLHAFFVQSAERLTNEGALTRCGSQLFPPRHALLD